MALLDVIRAVRRLLRPSVLAVGRNANSVGPAKLAASELIPSPLRTLLSATPGAAKGTAVAAAPTGTMVRAGSARHHHKTSHEAQDPERISLGCKAPCVVPTAGNLSRLIIYQHLRDCSTWAAPSQVAGSGTYNHLEIAADNPGGPVRLPKNRLRLRLLSQPCPAKDRMPPRQRSYPTQLVSVRRWCSKSPTDTTCLGRCPDDSLLSDRESGKRLPAVSGSMFCPDQRQSQSLRHEFHDSDMSHSARRRRCNQHACR